MFPNIIDKINWLHTHKNVFKKICRGIERETLRITLNGTLSNTNHPKLMGSKLTHQWITTDFSENLIEFITPKIKDKKSLLAFLRDIYRYACKNLNQERMWALSMPYFDSSNQSIKIADFGSSKIGINKKIYRMGLKHRYGSFMNTIAGIHYNFSLPLSFWKKWKGVKNEIDGKEIISNGYLNLIRNFYRFGWILSYFFGASPTISPYMIQKNNKYSFKFTDNKKNMLYMPWATSLRTSSIGHNNKTFEILKIKFNSLEEYINQLKYGLNTPKKEFVKIGLQDTFGNFKQINTNLLQLENELYTQIRPKPKKIKDESLISALEKQGISYVEIRSLDVNPFSSIGINKTQIIFLDLFLIWCILIDSPFINDVELQSIYNNWETIAINGRHKNISVSLNNYKQKISFFKLANLILVDLSKIAHILDENAKIKNHELTCRKMIHYLKNPNLTYSARILEYILNLGMKETGLYFSNKYYIQHVKEPFELISHETFLQQVNDSYELQSKIESILTTNKTLK